MLATVTRAVARLSARRELCRQRGVRHQPTGAQARLYADLRGCEPQTYLLDPDANWMPRRLELEHHYGLAFTFRDGAGRRHDTVALPDGSRFEPLAPVTEHEPLAACERH